VTEATLPIPHRPPFLFVDDIVERRADGLTARRKWRDDEEFYAGHYPGNPITPGVLLCEACFQAGAVYLVEKYKNEGVNTDGRTPVLSRIGDAKFRQLVRPGEVIYIHVTHLETKGQFAFMRAVVNRESGGKAMTVEFALALVAGQAE